MRNDDVNRRNFLKGSLIGAGALTVGVGTGLFMPTTAHAALPYLKYHDAGATVLDPDEVRRNAWFHYHTNGG